MSARQPHWPSWFWSREALAMPSFVLGVRSLLRETRGLPLAGWETSCRFSAQGVRSDRLLLGLDLAGVAPSRLSALLEALNMPSAFFDGFTRCLPQARQIMLAIERQGSMLDWRAYQTMRQDSVLSSSGLAMRGYKWLADGDEGTTAQQGGRITDYWRAPMQTAQLRALLQQCPGVSASAKPAYAVLERALGLALQRRPGWREHEFLVASEEGGARASCCMRLYESGLSGHDLTPCIDDLLTAWGWQPQARALALQPLAPRPVGWLAAGIDRQQQAFLTVYCEAGRDDASHALLNGHLHATA